MTQQIIRHLSPIYGSPMVHSRFEKLLNQAKFQKGCINFKNGEGMPLEIIRQMIDDCAKVDLVAIMEGIKKNSDLNTFKNIRECFYNRLGGYDVDSMKKYNINSGQAKKDFHNNLIRT